MITLDHAFDNKPLPAWQNGFLVAYDHDQQPAVVFAFDGTGKLVTRATLDIPDAVQVRLGGPAASSGGTLAIAGTAWTARGVGARFIAWISPSGRVERIVQTSTFLPLKLCFDGHGSLWALGKDHDPHARTEHDHDVLRRYGPDGVLIQTALPRSTFAVTGVERHPAERGFLACSGSTVGVYSIHGQEWVQVSQLIGAEAPRTGPRLPQGSRVTGVALASDGAVYLSAEEPDGSYASSHATIYVLKKNGSRWLPVDAATVFGPGRRHGYIVGADDDNHVIIKAQAPGPSQLFFVSLE
jgi:hypothetical protein